MNVGNYNNIVMVLLLSMFVEKSIHACSCTISKYMLIFYQIISDNTHNEKLQS